MLHVVLDQNTRIKFIMYMFALIKRYDPNFHTLLTLILLT